MSTEPAVTVRDNPQAGRFEVLVGDQVAGFTEYRDQDGVRTFPHTLVEEAFQGRGLAAKVIEKGLADTRAAGLQVLPLCPAVQRYIKKNPHYLDLVPAQRRADVGLG